VKVSWADAKNAANQKKHGISFDEARDLFTAGEYLEVFDEQHSETEDRFIAIGLIGRGLIVVVWTQSEEQTAHIISARFATKREEELYESYIGRRDD
jgi:hypothetical protein